MTAVANEIQTAGRVSAMIIFPIIVYLLGALCCFFIFKKTERKPSLAFVPFYREYIMLDIIKMNRSWFLLYLAVEIIGTVNMYLRYLGIINIPILNILLSAGGIVYGILFIIHLGDAFAKGASFKVGLFLLPTIFKLILGLGNSKYVYAEKKSGKKKKKLDKK